MHKEAYKSDEYLTLNIYLIHDSIYHFFYPYNFYYGFDRKKRVKVLLNHSAIIELDDINGAYNIYYPLLNI